MNRFRIADRTVLVTGANRGIGKALVEEALRRGAKRVYAGSLRVPRVMLCVFAGSMKRSVGGRVFPQWFRLCTNWPVDRDFLLQ
jgi:hypothetical protein